MWFEECFLKPPLPSPTAPRVLLAAAWDAWEGSATAAACQPGLPEHGGACGQGSGVATAVGRSLCHLLPWPRCLLVTTRGARAGASPEPQERSTV